MLKKLTRIGRAAFRIVLFGVKSKDVDAQFCISNLSLQYLYWVLLVQFELKPGVAYQLLKQLSKHPPTHQTLTRSRNKLLKQISQMELYPEDINNMALLGLRERYKKIAEQKFTLNEIKGNYDLQCTIYLQELSDLSWRIKRVDVAIKELKKSKRSATNYKSFIEHVVPDDLGVYVPSLSVTQPQESDINFEYGVAEWVKRFFTLIQQALRDDIPYQPLNHLLERYLNTRYEDVVSLLLRKNIEDEYSKVRCFFKKLGVKPITAKTFESKDPDTSVLVVLSNCALLKIANGFAVIVPYDKKRIAVRPLFDRSRILSFNEKTLLKMGNECNPEWQVVYYTLGFFDANHISQCSLLNANEDGLPSYVVVIDDSEVGLLPSSP